jgi:thiamine biosynthesis lipoprotein
VSAATEASASFDCFGSRCSAYVTGGDRSRSAEEAVELVRTRLLGWHERFSRFLPDSELSRLNADPREAVPASTMMRRLARAVRAAGGVSGGLVDATLVGEIERAGYGSTARPPLDLASALALAPQRQRAASAPGARWREIAVDDAAGTVIRPPGVMLDSGGLAKGLFADALAEELGGHASFAVNCAGDLALGGSAGAARRVDVESPFDGRILHSFPMVSGGVATSGIGRRSWLAVDGTPAHHLLDPATGRPAFTGIVQATALAPSALQAEIRAKAALLGGPRSAARWLVHGGVLVLDDGSHHVIAPPPTVLIGGLSRSDPARPPVAPAA